MLAAALAFIALATLLPGDSRFPAPSDCLVCGDRGVADAILNLILFAPLGGALAVARPRPGPIAAIGLGVSFIVELLQIYIPGRDPSAGDLLFNTAGALCGAGLPALLRGWYATFPTGARIRAGGWVAAALTIVTVTGILLQPALQQRPYYGQWRPLFANRDQYNGVVTAARIGDLRIPDGESRRSAALRARLLRGDILRIEAVSGPRPQDGAFVFNIYDDREREVLSILADSSDIVISYRLGANRFRLDQPTFRVRNALGGIGAHQPWSVEIQLLDGGVCVRRDAFIACPVGVSVARGWSVLLHTDMPESSALLLDVIWLLLLFLPAGTYVRHGREGVLLAIIAAGGFVVVSRVSGLLPPSLIAIAATAGGVLLGAVLGHRLQPETIEA